MDDGYKRLILKSNNYQEALFVPYALSLQWLDGKKVDNLILFRDLL